MPWVETPTRGSILGVLRSSEQARVDGANIRIKRAGWWPFRRSQTVISDGNGYFGSAQLKAGKYSLSTEGKSSRSTAEVRAGQVTRSEVNLD